MTVQTRGAELLGRTLGGRYRLLAVIGAGASAGVYLAEDTSLRRRVAVKVLHPGLAADDAFQRRFRAEARAAAALSHPHVLAVHDWGESDGAYLVTELLEGGSLRDLLATGARLSLSQALLVGLHAAQGLQYASRHGLVHRDIKPANLLFDRDGRLRIADFGIARAVAEAAWTEPQGVLVGTARYAAPEQATGGPVDGRADVYSLALTVVESVTGDVPLVGDTPLGTIALRQSRSIPVPDALGPLVEPLRAAGAHRPDDRVTAAALVDALLAAATRLERPAPLPLPGLPTGPVQPAPGERTESARARPVDAETGFLPPAPVDPPAPGIGPTRDEPSEPVQAAGASSRQGRRRRRWPKVLLALLVLGGAGGGVWQYLRTRTPAYEVEAYVGTPIDELRREAADRGWVLAETSERRDGSRVGDVLEQQPGPDTELSEGEVLTVVVSEGQLLRTVPAVAGLTRDEAAAALEQALLSVGRITPAFDEQVPPGAVVSAASPPGSRRETGTPVDLVVSQGPAPRTVPALVGTAENDAVAALEGLGLVAQVDGEYSEEVDEGIVLSVEPAAGGQVARGATVQLVVSLGPPLIAVPNVVGLSAAEASDRLEAAGFVVVDTIGPPNRPVLVTDPPAGESRRKGQSVTIVTRAS
jgi:serine/threonine-protein kinase